MTIFADPRDTHREDGQSRFDFRTEWSFAHVKDRGHGSVVFDVFNLFNANAVTNRNEGTGITAQGTPTFGRPLAVQSPRTARIGFRFRF